MQCQANTTEATSRLMGAKIALMDDGGNFVDVADGAQLSPLSSLLWELDPLYDADGYCRLRPELVIEVSYQGLYVDRKRPVLAYTPGHYEQIGSTTSVALRPYLVRPGEDKRVDSWDLRLDQMSHLVNRVHRIRDLVEGPRLAELPLPEQARGLEAQRSSR